MGEQRDGEEGEGKGTEKESERDALSSHTPRTTCAISDDDNDGVCVCVSSPTTTSPTTPSNKQLDMTRGEDNQLTLMQYLAKYVTRRCPKVKSFTDDLAVLEESSRGMSRRVMCDVHVIV